MVYTSEFQSSTGNLNAFKAALVREFVPSDHVRRARDKLRKLKQVKSVASYLEDFRNIMLTIPGVPDDEKFVSGLKKDVCIEVLKSTATVFDQAAQIALRVDGAIWSNYNAERPVRANVGSSNSTPVPMEIGNIEGKKGNSRRESYQRIVDRQKNACIVCHTPGCRPWKHKNAEVNNVAVENENATETVLSDSSDQEN